MADRNQPLVRTDDVDWDYVDKGTRGNPYLPIMATSQLEEAMQKGLLVLKDGLSLPLPDFVLALNEYLPPGSYYNVDREYSSYIASLFTEESIASFCDLAAFYQKAAEVYLFVALKLDGLDNDLIGSNLGFSPAPLSRRSIYQERSVLGLEIVFIRIQACHIEEMSIDDLGLLRQLQSDKAPDVTDDALSLVADTIQSVVREYDAQGLPYPDQNLTSNSAGMLFDPNAVQIVCLNIMRYEDDGSLKDAEEAAFYTRMDYLLDILPAFVEKAGKTLGMPVMFKITEGTFENKPYQDDDWYTIGSWGVSPDPEGF
ncbi:MAG: hypothetical protein FWH40_02550 [Coriobacteriia bacterium]|nr:hypothetical protein [Coriobacteriia bacterium]